MLWNGFVQNLPLLQGAKKEISLFWTFPTWHVCCTSALFFENSSHVIAKPVQKENLRLKILDHRIKLKVSLPDVLTSRGVTVVGVEEGAQILAEDRQVALPTGYS